MDIDKIRADTPGMDNVIHFGSAGASLMPSCVVDAMVEHIKLEATIGGYEAAAQQGEALNAVYSKVSALLNSDSSEIALTDNATTAWQKAFYSIRFKEGDIILTTQAEYSSNYIAFLQIAKNTGAQVRTCYYAIYATHVQMMSDANDP